MHTFEETSHIQCIISVSAILLGFHYFLTDHWQKYGDKLGSSLLINVNKDVLHSMT